jgi:hypothetical protein
MRVKQTAPSLLCRQLTLLNNHQNPNNKQPPHLAPVRALLWRRPRDHQHGGVRHGRLYSRQPAGQRAGAAALMRKRRIVLCFVWSFAPLFSLSCTLFVLFSSSESPFLVVWRSRGRPTRARSSASLLRPRSLFCSSAPEKQQVNISVRCVCVHSTVVFHIPLPFACKGPPPRYAIAEHYPSLPLLLLSPPPPALLLLLPPLRRETKTPPPPSSRSFSRPADVRKTMRSLLPAAQNISRRYSSAARQLYRS